MKAQIFSMDLFIAITILLIIIGGLGIIIYEFNVHQQETAENRDMQLKGEAAINSLIQSPSSENPEGG